MPQKKISQLPRATDLSLNKNVMFEISSYNDLDQIRESQSTTAADLGKAIFSSYPVGEERTTIERQIKAAKENNEFNELFLYDDSGKKWKLCIIDGQIKLEDEEYGQFLHEMAVYKNFINTPVIGGQDESKGHNYIWVTNNLPSGLFTDEEINAVKNNGSQLVIFANQPIPLGEKNEWNNTINIFDPLFLCMRFRAKENEEDEDGKYDSEYQQAKTILNSVNNLFNIIVDWTNNHNPTKSVPVEMHDYFRTNFLSNYIQVYKNQFQTTMTSYSADGRSQTRELFEKFPAQATDAKEKIEEIAEYIFNFLYEPGTVPNKEIGYETYYQFCEDEKDPEKHHQFPDPETQYTFDSYVQILETSIRTIMKDLSQYFPQCSAEHKTEDFFNLERKIKSYILQAGNSYENAIEMIK